MTFGQLQFDDGYYLIVNSVPVVRELAKRVFPGCSRPGRGDLRFRATRRAIGELNWLMTRYPLRILCEDLYERHRVEAVQHAIRREANAGVGRVRAGSSFRGTLMPFQEEGVAHLVHNPRTLLADDMGLGKTVQALAALSATGAFPAVIVAPASVQSQWCRQIETFIGRQRIERLAGLTSRPLGKSDIYVIHYGLLRAWRDSLAEIRPQTIVFDELQELRRPHSHKYSAASLLSEGPDFVWGLSGTPIHNYGAEMWAVLNILDYHCLGDFESFTREWCGGYRSEIVSEPDALGDHLKREGLMLRRLKADVQSQLPPKRRCVSYIDHDADVYRRAIAEAQELAAKYAQITEWHKRGQAAQYIDQQSRRATGLAKASYAATFARSLIEAGERPLIYAWHHDVHDTIAAQLDGLGLGIVTGRQSPREKDAAVAAFTKGNLNAMLLSLRATAGLDGLQGRASCVVFVELDWSPAVHSQCEDRMHRIGVSAMDSVLCYYLVTSTGHDTVVMDALGLKVGQFVGLMGDKQTSEDGALTQQEVHRHLESVINRLRDAPPRRAQEALIAP